MDELLRKVAFEAAIRAGNIAALALEKPREVQKKGPRDIVTDADLAAEETIIKTITSHFPDHSICSEEKPFHQGNSPYTWYIDPLDGTTNYFHRLPFFCASVAVAERGELIFGVVYEPLGKRLFWAEKGKGAYLNGKPLRVSPTFSLEDSLIGMDLPRLQALRVSFGSMLPELIEKVGTIRAMGSAVLGLCFVAAGWLDAYFHFSLKPWDLAAGALIVEEAGGKVTKIDGKPWNVKAQALLASNGFLHEELLKILGDFTDS
jgi:myo-inositol-1(or 4)-monophosphatase